MRRCASSTLRSILEIIVNNTTVALAGLAWVAGTALAQNPQTLSVTEAAAPVPPVLYRSVFADTPKGLEQENADWKKANAEVGQFRRGHVDILKWEAEQARAKAPASGAGTPASPAQGGHTQHGGKP
jgi:hypothetical protein